MLTMKWNCGMTTLLHLDASARIDRSLSRPLSTRFLELWPVQEPDVTFHTAEL